MLQTENFKVQAIFGDKGVAPVSVPSNITTVYREAFEVYRPNIERWNEQKAAGDIVVVDGNCAAASYLVISKDPLQRGTETIIESMANFQLPVELAVGLSMSQRTLGQEFSVELVSLEQTNPIADMAISSISQSGSTLTITTSAPHGLTPGRRIGVTGVSDSRLDYPALVIDSVPAPNQITAAAGPMGALPSVTAGPFAGGFVFVRSALGNAENGSSIIFEQASATSASFYIRSESGDVLPSGTITGSHSTTIGTTTGVQAVNRAASYSFQPATEFKLTALSDKVQWSDVPVDSTNAATARVTRTQVVPDPASTYKLRIRATNSKSHSVPVGRIVNASKSGSSTATITTDVPHGLTTADQVLIWGLRDQTNFTATGTPVAVASVISSTQFTVSFGASFTGTSTGGFVASCNGNNTALGFISQAVQSASVAAGILTLAGSANWSGLTIGDYVNLHGARNAANGADMGLDGVYRVRNFSAATLDLEALDPTPVPANLATINCGGAIIKRTDLRISYVRVFDFERHRVELMPRPNGDNGSSVPVFLNNNVIGVSSTVAVDSTFPSPHAIGGRASNANITPMSATGDLVGWLMTMIGVGIVKPYCLPEAEWTFSNQLTTTADVLAIASPGAGLRRHVTSIWMINTGASLVELIVKDGTTERHRYPLPVNTPVSVDLPTGIGIAVNTAINVALSAAGTVRINMNGYTAP